MKLLRSFKLVNAVKLLNVAYDRLVRSSLPFSELMYYFELNRYPTKKITAKQKYEKNKPKKNK